ncbi:MAG TPA: hypothetical protein VNQ77_15890 [Frankiaceae bacterium]|nr:hypothetical protein [Frankiaceae bacterium]
MPGSEAANRAVARSGGCEGCDWTLIVDCDLNEHDSDSFVHCNPAECPDGTTFRIYLQRPTDANPAYVDSICLSATRRIVTAADLSQDMDRYLKDLRPPTATITIQPAERAVTGLPAYFAAGGETTDTATLDVDTAAGPARLEMDITAGRYVWTFGDGARCETTRPGGAYDGGEATERCDDRVAHVYDSARTATVTLSAQWSGTYTFDVGYGPVGPLDIPGDGVTGPAATRTLTVRDARAQLIGG